MKSSHAGQLMFSVVVQEFDIFCIGSTFYRKDEEGKTTMLKVPMKRNFPPHYSIVSIPQNTNKTMKI